MHIKNKHIQFLPSALTILYYYKIPYIYLRVQHKRLKYINPYTYPYSNIPIADVKNTINEILNRNDGKVLVKEKILNPLNVELERNYLPVNEQYYTQNEGLATGTPTSATLAEVNVQHLEHTFIADILNRHTITDYYRYVDDILIVDKEQKANIANMLEDFNAIHPELKFTMEQQTQNIINYLNLTIKKNQMN